MITRKELAKMIDHTLLKADANNAMFDVLCEEAKTYGFKMVAINSSPVAYCSDKLKGTGVNVGAAIGFPLGQTTISTKVFETEDAIRNGANEIDYVINIRELKNGNLEYVRKEMEAIVSVCRAQSVTSKVILETCYLSDEEKRAVCEIAVQVKPDFVKTSTGFGTDGARLEDIRLMKEVVGDSVAIKAAGGIRDLETALQMIEAGASRIGTSSGIAIVEALLEP
ncbi:deoxyribose-phosphate aldolase [Erysipelothrix sp. HDW6A]|uniref:deoxyribose-phosphate aldolase n=1 Tax=Erysipelothrix sp. HDW6A TaxID=2714928 RepID=UPI00140E1BFF|nr:deoxyribose-phosphate aldolase [Erysipelothrix sp. HDW6A]QIK58169.1 deoxyribose-phosphate aldolase [Erysipelothrix sp. HDW6A]